MKTAKAIYQTGFVTIFTCVFVLVYVSLCLLTLGLFYKLFSRACFRNWARACLWIFDIKVDVKGMEHLTSDSSRLIVFNHTSILDNWICLSIFPDGGIPVVKKEVLYYPIIGWALFFMDVVLVNRKNREESKRSFEKLGERMKTENLTVFISPEGTRTRTGELLPFKMGAFHIALATRAPIVPFLFHNARELLPMGQYFSTPGTVNIEVLPPIPTDDYTEDNLREKADEVRNIFLERLSS